jgi:hypothetical protein
VSNQPFMFYVLAIIVVKSDVAVVCSPRSIMFKHHYPRHRSVISERRTKDKYETRDLFGSVCFTQNASVLRNDLWQVLRNKPPQLVGRIERGIQSIPLPLFLILFESLKLIAISIPWYGCIREIQRNVSAGLSETLNLFEVPDCASPVGVPTRLPKTPIKR